MKTFTNNFGEVVTKWESHKHPDNPNFMQVVLWTVWEKPDGRITVAYSLGGGMKPKFIYGIDKETALKLYVD